MWNEEQSALIPARTRPQPFDSEHLIGFGGRPTRRDVVKVLCKYWSIIFCNISINLFIYGDMHVWIGFAYVTYLQSWTKYLEQNKRNPGQEKLGIYFCVFFNCYC